MHICLACMEPPYCSFVVVICNRVQMSCKQGMHVKLDITICLTCMWWLVFLVKQVIQEFATVLVCTF